MSRPNSWCKPTFRYQKCVVRQVAEPRRCSALKLHNVRTICHLFDALARPIVPIASCACEIWAPDMRNMRTRCKIGIARWARALLQCCITLLCVKICMFGTAHPVTHMCHVSHVLMLEELGRHPISFYWLLHWLGNKIQSNRQLSPKNAHQNIAILHLKYYLR